MRNKFLLFFTTVILGCQKDHPLPKIPQVNVSQFDYFNKAIDFVFRNEGYYANHPFDRGGKTKYGISQKSYPKINIEKLQKDDAKQIYYNDFWKKYNVHLIKNERLAIRLFDTMVLSGPRRATLILEESIVRLGYDIPVDGIFDPELLNIINKMSPEEIEKLLIEFQKEMIDFFKDIVKANPSQKVFLMGWINRANILV
jgi:lysozyme family protein